MTWWRAVRILRGLALAAVVAAVVDPGCPRPRRPVLALLMPDDLPAASHDRVRQRVIDAAGAWADVRSAPLPVEPREPLPAVAADARIVAGHPNHVNEALERMPAALAVRVEDPTLELTLLQVPTRVASGGRVAVQASIAGVPPGAGTVTLRISDRESGREVALVENDASRAVDGILAVEADWLPVQPGHEVLRAVATYSGTHPVRAASPADVTVDVTSLATGVSVFDARPSWSARFARQALDAEPGIAVSTYVRAAPGIAVETRMQSDAARLREDDAAVIIVGGVDALTREDVASLEQAADKRGRAVVLLLDEAPTGGPWRHLWPGELGPVRRAAQPRPATIGSHRWITREWLSPAVSTGTVPLAYLDSERQAIVAGRGLGAGRVLLVSALDAWRWRAAEGAEFDRGWRALVRALAADVPPPLSLTAWTGGRGAGRRVHADVRLRPDIDAAGATDVRGEIAWNGQRQSLRLASAGDGRWTAAVRPWDPSDARLSIEAVRDGGVVAEAQAVIHVSGIAQTTTWADVAHHQREAGAAAAREADLGPALDALRSTMGPAPTVLVRVTRTWWYAAAVLGLLGSEWILRRLQRRR